MLSPAVRAQFEDGLARTWGIELDLLEAVSGCD